MPKQPAFLFLDYLGRYKHLLDKLCRDKVEFCLNIKVEVFLMTILQGKCPIRHNQC